MKKIFFLIVSISIFFNSNVKAASLCDYKEQAEINGKAANIKASYEVTEEKVLFDDGTVIKKEFVVTIINLTEDFYLVIKNNINDEKLKYTYKNSNDGIISFNWDDINEVTNLTIEIYSSSKTSCPDERYKTLYLTIPRYNEYFRRAICSDYPDFYLCQEFVTFSKVDENTFLKQLNNYKKGNTSINDDDGIIDDKTPQKNLVDYINEYKWIIVGSFVFVVAVIVIISRIRSKKQRDFK